MEKSSRPAGTLFHVPASTMQPDCGSSGCPANRVAGTDAIRLYRAQDRAQRRGAFGRNFANRRLQARAEVVPNARLT